MFPRNYFAAVYFTPNYWALGFGGSVATVVYRRIAGVRRPRAR